MKNRKVIKRSNFRIGNPLLLIIVGCLLLDRINAPSWVLGGAGVIAIVIIVVYISDLINTTEVDLFDKED